MMRLEVASNGSPVPRRTRNEAERLLTVAALLHAASTASSIRTRVESILRKTLDGPLCNLHDCRTCAISCTPRNRGVSSATRDVWMTSLQPPRLNSLARRLGSSASRASSSLPMRSRTQLLPCVGLCWPSIHEHSHLHPSARRESGKLLALPNTGLWHRELQTWLDRQRDRQRAALRCATI